MEEVCEAAGGAPRIVRVGSPSSASICVRARPRRSPRAPAAPVGDPAGWRGGEAPLCGGRRGWRYTWDALASLSRFWERTRDDKSSVGGAAGPKPLSTFLRGEEGGASAPPRMRLLRDGARGRERARQVAGRGPTLKGAEDRTNTLKGESKAHPVLLPKPGSVACRGRFEGWPGSFELYGEARAAALSSGASLGFDVDGAAARVALRVDVEPGSVSPLDCDAIRAGECRRLLRYQHA